MLVDRGDLPTGQTVPFFFPAYDSNGASVTITGLAVTDIEIFKGTSMTQRASDNGYSLVDTDGIDIDSRTGIHGFAIDMSDDSDAGFYAAGSFYHLVVDAVTIDTQTVRFIFSFSLGFTLRPTTTGRTLRVESDNMAYVDCREWLGGTIATPDTTGYPVVTIKDGTGQGEINLSNGQILGVYLGDGVHGGTAATLDLQYISVINQNGSAATFTSSGFNGHGIICTGNGSGEGMKLLGGATGNALELVGGGTSGDGFLSTVTSGAQFRADITGNLSGTIGSLATQAKADVQAEAEEALQTYHLDHLIGVADPGGIVANSSLWAALVSKSATPAYSDYVNTTDSLQALRDAASTHTAADVWSSGTRTLTAATNLSALAQASVCTEARLAELDAANLPADVAAVKVDTAATLLDTGTDGVIVASFTTAAKASIEEECEDALQLTVADSVPADGSRPSVQQAVYMILQALIEGSISGTTWTIKKVDASTSLFTVTLDSATTPTSKTRAT